LLCVRARRIPKDENAKRETPFFVAFTLFIPFWSSSGVPTQSVALSDQSNAEEDKAASTMARKKSKKNPRQRNRGGGTTAAAAMNKRGDDDAFLEEAMQRAAAERKAMDDGSRNSIISSSSILSSEVIILLSNDVLGNISSFLACKDLFNLSLTCKKMTGAIEDVALQMIGAAQVRYGGDNDEDMSALKKMQLLLHSPLLFTDLLGENLGYLRGDKACVYSSNPNRLHTPEYIDGRCMELGGGWDGWEGTSCTAICSDYVMTSGRHYAKFTVTSETYWEDAFRYFYCRLGIMRPIGLDLRRTAWPEWCPIHDQLLSGLFLDGSFAEHHRTDAWGEGNVHCCLYCDFQDTCEWSNWDSEEEGIHKDLHWDGMLGCSLLHDTREYGLLLDLDAGALSMYEDDRCLGVMMRGLTGEYCWVANVLAQAHGRPDEQNVRIERAPVPW
jgi:hypothetical protein